MADPKTRDELVEKALANLGVALIDQSTPAELSETVDALVDPFAEQLASEWGVDLIAHIAADEIPLEFFLPLGWLLAQTAGSEMGLVKDTKVDAMAAQSLATLLRIVASKPTGETQVAEYF